jgi:hypothetical protein
MRRYLHLLLCFFLIFGLVKVSAQTTDRPISIDEARVEVTEEGCMLVANFHLELPRELEDALQRGVPLYFTTELQVYRPRWYWFDLRIIDTTRTVRMTYNVLTRRYSITVDGGLQHRVNTLEEALNFVRRPRPWLFDDLQVLKKNETYYAAVRIQLDMSYLPKPFQIDVINDRAWRLYTNWKNFTFTF